MLENTEERQLMERYLRNSHVFNLATAVDNQPSNRFMFYFTPVEFNDTIYAVSPFDSRKLFEIEQNAQVSFATMPTRVDQGVVTSNTATAPVSDRSIRDILPLIQAQIPNWEAIAGDVKDNFVVIEIKFQSAKIFGHQGITSL